MSKTTMTAVFTAALALSPMALAPAYAQNAPAAHAAGTMTQMQSNQIRVSKFIGSTVYDVQNRNIGDVKDMVMDHDGKVAAVIVDVGAFLGMGGKYVAVPLNDIKTDNNRLTLDMSKEQLQQAQAFTFNDTNSVGTSTPPRNNNTNNPNAGNK